MAEEALLSSSARAAKAASIEGANAAYKRKWSSTSGDSPVRAKRLINNTVLAAVASNKRSEAKQEKRLRDPHGRQDRE